LRIKCSLHNHSTNSDGSLPPEKMVARIADKGFKVIAITDHDWITVVLKEYLPDDVIYLRGYEWTARNNLHIIKLETPSREHPELAMLDWIAHPSRWHSIDEALNLVRSYKLNGLEKCNRNIEQYIEELLGVVEFGVDDAHNEWMIGHNWIEIETDSLDKYTVIEKLKSGEFEIMRK